MNEKEISRVYDEFMNSQVKNLKSLFLRCKAQYGLSLASIYDLLEKEAIRRNDQDRSDRFYIILISRAGVYSCPIFISTNLTETDISVKIL